MQSLYFLPQFPLHLFHKEFLQTFNTGQSLSSSVRHIIAKDPTSYVETMIYENNIFYNMHYY